MWSRSDSLRLVLTGAGSDGAAQADPAASLGGYRSSTIAGSAPFIPPNLAGIRVIYVSQACGPGNGTLTALDANTLAWCAPNDAAGSGPPVAIANGQTVLLESAGGSDLFILLTRFSAADLVGNATLEILQQEFNDAIGQSNGTLPGTTTTYRALMLKNGPTQVVRNMKIWIASADNGIQIALESPASQPSGNIQTIANETTAPTGLTFVAPTSSSDPSVLSVPVLRPGQQFGLWIQRSFVAAAASGSIQILGTPPDGRIVTISDGIISQFFRFITVPSGPFDVDTNGASPDTIAANLLTCIQATALNLTGILPGSATVALVNNATGAAGNVAITTDDPADVLVTGMSGGQDGAATATAAAKTDIAWNYQAIG